MANRIIYQSDALYASKSVRSTGRIEHKQLRRIQSANYSFNVNRTDVNQFGALARIDSTILETPTVSVDLTYLLGDGFNELALGFSPTSGTLSTGFISNQISATSENATSGINLYMLTTPEGKDANVARTEKTNDYSTIGLGNCYLSDYSLDASVGDFPTITVSLEGLNANSTTQVSGVTGLAGSVVEFGAGNILDTGAAAAGEIKDGSFDVARSAAGKPGSSVEINAGVKGFISGVGVDVTNGTQLATQGSGVILSAPSQSTGAAIVNALKPGDMSLSLGNTKGFFKIGGGSSDGHIQSISLSVPLSRTPIEKLGSTFAFARVADFPITPTLSVSAVVNETQDQALHDVIANDSFIDELSFSFANTAGSKQVEYTLKNAKVESEAVSSSIGPNKTVDLTFSVTIGGPDDTTNNVFFSGIAAGPGGDQVFV